MSSAKIIVILALAVVGYTAAEITTLLNRKEKLNGDTFKIPLIKNLSKDRLYFPYATCKNNVGSIDCKIFRQSLNGKSEPSVCSVSFNKSPRIMGIVKFQDFDDDKVIIYWYDEKDKQPNYYIRLTTVQFSDCSTGEGKIKFDLDLFRKFNFIKSSGAILPNGDKLTIAHDKSGFISQIVQQTFDVRGNTIGDAKFWFTPLSKDSIFLTYKLKGSNHALFEIDVVTHKSKFSLLTENGQKTLSETPFYNEHQDLSASHDIIRSCRQVTNSSSKIDCTTYSENGKFFKNIQIDLHHNPSSLNIHNLADGGFLLTVRTAEKVYYMSKFDADGKLKASMELPEYKCDGKQNLNLYDNQNKHCLLRFCVDNEKFDIVNKCFGDDDIK